MAIQVPEHLVCDSSVAIRWYLDQVGYPAARELLGRAVAGDVVLAAPTVILWEAGHVLLTKGVRSGRMTGEDLDDALRVVRELCELVDVAPERAGALARELGAAYFDGAFAAVALDRGLPVVTADVRFANAVSGRISTVLL